MDFASRWDDELRSVTTTLCEFETTAGNEETAQGWLRDRLDSWGFDTYEWEADAQRLAGHPSFPDDPDEIETAGRPSVAGVLEFGDPDDGPTLVLNGHVDVVSPGSGWTGDPFEPRWNDGAGRDVPEHEEENHGGETLTALGTVDMKSGLATCVFAARHLEETAPDLSGRLVVESVAGEEEGGIGAAAAAIDNPYPFDRDCAIVAEPTELTPIVAVEGSLMKRLVITGRSAHAATRWRGESVLGHFERIRRAFHALESERSERVTHPLYEEYPIPWPVNFGRVEAGQWGSSVADELEADVRIGVAPGETVAEVEAEFDDRLADVVADDPWLAANPPTFERFSIQFEPAEISPDEPVVKAVQSAMRDVGLEETDPRGATYGADNRHYVEAGIPTVVFGPGTVERAHFPDECIDWQEVLMAGDVLVGAAKTVLSE